MKKSWNKTITRMDRQRDRDTHSHRKGHWDSEKDKEELTIWAYKANNWSVLCKYESTHSQMSFSRLFALWPFFTIRPYPFVCLQDKQSKFYQNRLCIWSLCKCFHNRNSSSTRVIAVNLISSWHTNTAQVILLHGLWPILENRAKRKKKRRFSEITKD